MIIQLNKKKTTLLYLVLKRLLNGLTLGDPKLHELQYASTMPFAGLSAPAIFALDMDKEFSH